MAQQEAAKALANLLSKVARWSVILGIGGSALQSSLYTGGRQWLAGAARAGHVSTACVGPARSSARPQTSTTRPTLGP